MMKENYEERFRELEEKVSQLVEFHDFKYDKCKKVVVRLSGFDMKRQEEFSKYLWKTRDFPYNPLGLGCVEIPERVVQLIKEEGYDIIDVDFGKLINDKKFTKAYDNASNKYLGLDKNL